MSWLLDRILWAEKARIKSTNALPAREASESESIAPPADTSSFHVSPTAAPDPLSSVALRVKGEKQVNKVEPHLPDDVLADGFAVEPQEDESAPSHAADELAQSEEAKQPTFASTDASTPEQAAVDATPEEHARIRTRNAEIAAAANACFDGSFLVSRLLWLSAQPP